MKYQNTPKVTAKKNKTQKNWHTHTQYRMSVLLLKSKKMKVPYKEAVKSLLERIQ